MTTYARARRIRAACDYFTEDKLYEVLSEGADMFHIIDDDALAGDTRVCRWVDCAHIEGDWERVEIDEDAEEHPSATDMANKFEREAAYWRERAEKYARVLFIHGEDELEQIISDTLDMDWNPRDAARAITAAIQKALADYEPEDKDNG